MVNTALISSDGLLSSDFLAQTEPGSENMYLSGPATLSDDTAFMQEYKSTYGENPVASYHAQAYDAAEMLFKAIEEVAVKESGGTVHIPRQALRSALFNIKDMQGLSGTLSCSLLGDCAIPNILIYQVRNQQFVPVYP
jgi:branched-chain amino acid transport system substrate-binding protein